MRDLRALAETVRVTCTSLPNDSIVEAVVLLGEPGHDGLLAGARRVIAATAEVASPYEPVLKAIGTSLF